MKGIKFIMKSVVYFKSLLLILIFMAFGITSVVSQTTFEDALKSAKQNNKRVIVDVYTDWCGWCHKMDNEIYGSSEIKQLVKDNFEFVKLNAEGSDKINYNGKTYTSTELAILFEAVGYPTTVFLEPDGKLIEYNYDSSKMKSLPGYFSKEDFKKILDFIKEGKYKDSDLSKVI